MLRLSEALDRSIIRVVFVRKRVVQELDLATAKAVAANAVDHIPKHGKVDNLLGQQEAAIPKRNDGRVRKDANAALVAVLVLSYDNASYLRALAFKQVKHLLASFCSLSFDYFRRFKFSVGVSPMLKASPLKHRGQFVWRDRGKIHSIAGALVCDALHQIIHRALGRRVDQELSVLGSENFADALLADGLVQSDLVRAEALCLLCQSLKQLGVLILGDCAVRVPDDNTLHLLHYSPEVSANLAKSCDKILCFFARSNGLNIPDSEFDALSVQIFLDLEVDEVLQLVGQPSKAASVASPEQKVGSVALKVRFKVKRAKLFSVQVEKFLGFLDPLGCCCLIV